jgi:hypothetical protein
MSFNKIINKKVLGSVTVSSGKSLVLSAATKTTNWERPDFMASAMREPLEKAVTANESVLPNNTAEVILR